MSISIYYTAKREQPLTPTEQAAIDVLRGRHAIEDQLAERETTGEGHNWESFCIYDPNEPSAPGVVFEGATKLPDNSEEGLWIGIQHWCRLLSEIRRVLPATSWRVHVDDRDIAWNEELREYDPSQ